MYDLGLLLGGFNPPHTGHFELIKKALERSSRLDVLVGLKRKHQLPYELRRRALQVGLEEYGLDDKVNILSKRRFHDCELNPYDVFVVGSDVFNKLDPTDERHSDIEKRKFHSFPNILVLERGGVPIDPRVLEIVRLRQNVEVYGPHSLVSASLVRKLYERGQSVRGFMPETSRRVIGPYSHLFCASH